MQSKLSPAAEAFLSFEEELLKLLDNSLQPQVYTQTLEWQI
jgi:hypothetical protein